MKFVNYLVQIYQKYNSITIHFIKMPSLRQDIAHDNLCQDSTLGYQQESTQLSARIYRGIISLLPSKILLTSSRSHPSTFKSPSKESNSIIWNIKFFLNQARRKNKFITINHRVNFRLSSASLNVGIEFSHKIEIPSKFFF